MSINLMYSLSGYFGFWITDIEKMGDRSKCLQNIYRGVYSLLLNIRQMRIFPSHKISKKEKLIKWIVDISKRSSEITVP